MKKMKLKLSLLAVLFSAYTFAQDASAYMESLNSGYQQIQTDMWDYTRTVSHGKSARKVEKRRMELIVSSDLALKNAKSVKEFNGSTAYKDSVVRYFEIINIVLKEDYAKIVNMEEVAEQSYDLMEAYILTRQLASEKQSEAAEMINREQAIFAEANNITLITEETDLNRKMALASKVYDHYNEVYLIFFKSNKQEMYLMDAIERQDVNAIEQNKEALISTVEEGREKLKTVEAYESDRSMIDATNSIFDFYEQEATKGMVTTLDYFLKSENFQVVKKSFDEIKEKNRTQKDVDTFNAAVVDMNNAVTAYNEQNEEFNTQRSKLIDNWNKTAEDELLLVILPTAHASHFVFFEKKRR